MISLKGKIAKCRLTALLSQENIQKKGQVERDQSNHKDNAARRSSKYNQMTGYT